MDKSAKKKKSSGWAINISNSNVDVSNVWGVGKIKEKEKLPLLYLKTYTAIDHLFGRIKSVSHT